MYIAYPFIFFGNLLFSESSKLNAHAPMNEIYDRYVNEILKNLSTLDLQQNQKFNSVFLTVAFMAHNCSQVIRSPY